MKKVLILGSTGMLGSALYDVLKDGYQLVLTSRNKDKIKLLDGKYGDISKCKSVNLDVSKVYEDYVNKKGHRGEYIENFIREVGEIDYVINAIGVTIPFSLKDPTMTLFTNGALPHILAEIFKEKLIHITTDCVYNGKDGFPYNEESPKTPVDIYGLSKSLGEPTNCLTIRTSIIGKELEGHTGFLDWFLQQEGKEITGFAEHYWNGITTKQFGKICDQIMSNPDLYPKIGLYHIFSTTVSKYEMLLKFKEKFKINCVIKEDHENKLNRTLSTNSILCSLLKIPSFNEMIEDL
jgi:dTDP-4-dehydrorhamnose reductase